MYAETSPAGSHPQLIRRKDPQDSQVLVATMSPPPRQTCGWRNHPEIETGFGRLASTFGSGKRRGDYLDFNAHEPAFNGDLIAGGLTETSLHCTLPRTWTTLGSSCAGSPSHPHLLNKTAQSVMRSYRGPPGKSAWTFSGRILNSGPFSTVLPSCERMR